MQRDLPHAGCSLGESRLARVGFGHLHYLRAAQGSPELQSWYMGQADRILLLDDEETFLRSTQALLAREGYECDVAREGLDALSNLSAHCYDLLIADIRVHGNSDLELVRELAAQRIETPVILVTGYPSLRTAIDAFELPVVAYLVKPFEFADLLRNVKAAIARVRLTGVLQSARENAEAWGRQFELWGGSAGPKWRGSNEIAGFLSRIIENVQVSLRTMASLTLAVAEATGKSDAAPCHLLDCPRGTLFEDLLRETVQELEKTRAAFKSKDLGELRRKIERALEGDRVGRRAEGTEPPTLHIDPAR